jgi:outer membrane protein assembly factor BamB
VKRRTLATPFLCTILVALPASAAPAPDAPARWNQFRGPDGTAILDGAGLPDRWSREDNVAWVTEVPGHGWSSPIVWDGLVFLTTAVTDGEFKQPTSGIFGNGTIFQMLREGKSQEETMAYIRERDTELPEEAGEIRWLLIALDAETGDARFVRDVHRGSPPGGRHRKNTYASETPATDGELVYVLLGNLGLYAYDLAGNLRWSRQLETRPIYLDFGTGSSPVVDDRHVYVLCDNDQESYLAAFDKRTGEPSWRVVRSTGERHSAWSTPFLWRTPGRTDLVAPGSGMVVGYDPETGAERWRLSEYSIVATPMPFAHEGLLVLSSGSVSEPSRPLLVVRPGATGDITPGAGDTSSEHVVWLDRRGGTYIPTPVAYQGRIYSVYDKGFLAVWDMATGTRLFLERIGRGGNAFSASPWAYDGKVFALSEEGETFVFAAGDSYQLLHTNDLDELAFATPALTPQGIFVRTESRLFRIRASDARTPRL